MHGVIRVVGIGQVRGEKDSDDLLNSIFVQLFFLVLFLAHHHTVTDAHLSFVLFRLVGDVVFTKMASTRVPLRPQQLAATSARLVLISWHSGFAIAVAVYCLLTSLGTFFLMDSDSGEI